jgi:hypothetical protein
MTSDTASSVARQRSKEGKGSGRTDLDWDLINPILTKREHGKINGSLHPQSRRANSSSEGGGRLQFCLSNSMREVPKRLQTLLFFTFQKIA